MNGEQAALVILALTLMVSVLALAGAVAFLVWKWPRADMQIVRNAMNATAESFNTGLQTERYRAEQQAVHWPVGEMPDPRHRTGMEEPPGQEMNDPEHTAGESAGTFQ